MHTASYICNLHNFNLIQTPKAISLLDGIVEIKRVKNKLANQLFKVNSFKQLVKKNCNHGEISCVSVMQFWNSGGIPLRHINAGLWLQPHCSHIRWNSLHQSANGRNSLACSVQKHNNKREICNWCIRFYFTAIHL